MSHKKAQKAQKEISHQGHKVIRKAVYVLYVPFCG
jgi:hypothetical protein